MSRKDPTPVTPLRGVPVIVEDTDTGPMRKPLIEAASGQMPDGAEVITLHGVAEKLNELEKPGKRKSRLMYALVLAVIGPGGIMTAHYAMKSDVRVHTDQIESIEKTESNHNERIEENEKAVRYIRVDVGKLSTAQQQTTKVLEDVVEGLNDLKQENVDKLKEEKARLERELWLEKRRRNR